MQKELKFTPIGEQSYYTKKGNNEETIMYVGNKFRLSYYITFSNIYAYYMGNYYISDIVAGLEQIDLVNAILVQCSDIRSFDIVEELD